MIIMNIEKSIEELKKQLIEFYDIDKPDVFQTDVEMLKSGSHGNSHLVYSINYILVTEFNKQNTHSLSEEGLKAIDELKNNIIKTLNENPAEFKSYLQRTARGMGGGYIIGVIDDIFNNLTQGSPKSKLSRP